MKKILMLAFMAFSACFGNETSPKVRPLSGNWQADKTGYEVRTPFAYAAILLGT